MILRKNPFEMFFNTLSVLKKPSLGLRILSVSFIGVSFWSTKITFAKAQVTSDITLPINSTVLNTGTVTQIDGGTRTGNSLFHSFLQFSVLENETVLFNNAIEIENIFSRVTGANRSEINGTIQSAGAANLFLLNPNGIIFGERSQLDIGGSFVASTADYIEFSNDLQFSATNTRFQPLLSISVPIGLGFTNHSVEIINRSINGLKVPVGETIALVGGDISLAGGSLLAENGHIEVGSVAAPGFISLVSDNRALKLSYADNLNFQDIVLSEQAIINASGNGAGSIHIRGRKISLNEDSLVFVSTLGAEAGGGISLNASDFIELSGDVTGIFTEAFGSGAAGDINIETMRLTLRNGSFIGTQANSMLTTQPGNLSIQATELVEVVGTTSDSSFPSSIFASVFDNATGQNKTLNINTQQLTLQEGAQIFTETFGTGQGVNFIVNAAEIVTLSDAVNGKNGFPTGLFARSISSATGNAGALTINTQHFVAENGAQVSTDTQGQGSAGDLLVDATQSIVLLNTSEDGLLPSGIFAQVAPGASGNGGTLRLETNQLEILGGAQASTSGRSGGQGGTLLINAKDSILVSGTSSRGDSESNSNILVSAEPGSTQNAGELKITTDTLTVENRGKISADNLGTGNGSTATINIRQLLIRDGGRVGAGSLIDIDPDPNPNNTTAPSQLGPGGTLIINASEKIEVSGNNSQLFTRAEGAGPAGNLIINETPNSDLTVIVRDGAEISASTVSSTGGNITFNNPDAVLLRTGGRITAEAGSSQGIGDGGNITLTMPDGFLVSVADEDSDIIANAFAGTGGNINITTQGIFNLVERLAIPNNGTNDIDASSQFGQSGTVVINNPNLDPTRDLAELPTETTPSTVAQRCLADSEGQSAFVVTGQGGAPPTPIDIVRNESAGLIDLGNDGIVTRTEESHNIAITSSSDQTELPQLLIEAQGWQRDQAGNVVLMAQIPNPAPAVGQYTTVCTSSRG